MSLEKPRDLVAVMKAWPALTADGGRADERPETSWDERAEAIVQAARAAGPGDEATLDALFGEPALPPETGEDAARVHDEGAVGAPAPRNLRLAPGERTMSSDDGGRKSVPSGSDGKDAPADAPVPSQRKRTSLKEMAERASQSGAGRASIPSSPGAAPGRASTPPPSSTAPASRAGGSATGDSGIVNLNAIKSGATPDQIAAAEKAKPATESLFEEDGVKPAAAVAKAAPAKAAVPAPAPKKNNGVLVGGMIALVGIAAALAIVQARTQKPAAVAQVETTAKPAQHEEATTRGGPGPAATAAGSATANPIAAAPTSTAFDPDNLPEGEDAVRAPRAGGPVGGPAAAKEPAEPKGAAAPPVAVGKSGTLTEEMQKAVGADGRKKAEAESEDPAPANGHDQNLPEAPSQGAVQSAIGSVLGNAKGCVADADEPTRAVVTFSSSGSVASVTVSGWAAANGKSSCVVGALKAAKVGAFAKPSFAVPVTVRP